MRNHYLHARIRWEPTSQVQRYFYPSMASTMSQRLRFQLSGTPQERDVNNVPRATPKKLRCPILGAPPEPGTYTCHVRFSKQYQALTMCVPRMSTRHIQRPNLENIKNNALLYIKTQLHQDLHLLQSIAEAILYLLFGTPYSTGTVYWGSTRLVLLEHVL